jgi:4-hydroxy-tetrahydrodipicolinate synthase
MMTASAPVTFCMLATPFSKDGAIDEAGLRAHLRRIAGAGCGVFLASPGSGEGHALSADELRRLYEIGVEECKGRVPSCANPPEQRTSDKMIDVCAIAAKAGVGTIEVYQLDGGHGMRPTETEQERYYRDIFDAINHPVSLSVHAHSGYSPPTRLFRKLCADYPQIVSANLVSVPISYWIEMREALPPRVALYGIHRDALQTMALGAAGYQSAEANLFPYLCRLMGEQFVKGDIAGSREAYVALAEVTKILKQGLPAATRGLKIAMKVLGLPGGSGFIRKPYLALGQDETDKMAKAFAGLGIQQLEASARARLEA